MPRYWCKRFGSTNFVNYTLIFAIFCINIQFLGDVCISIWLLFQNFRFFSNSWHKHDTASNNCANTSKQKQNATEQVEFLKQLILVCLYLRCVLLFWLFVFFKFKLIARQLLASGEMTHYFISCCSTIAEIRSVFNSVK